jgi:hypothetical protein
MMIQWGQLCHSWWKRCRLFSLHLASSSTIRSYPLCLGSRGRTHQNSINIRTYIIDYIIDYRLYYIKFWTQPGPSSSMLKMLKNVNSDFKIFKIFKTSKKLCHHYWVILVRMRPHAALKAQVLARQLGIPCVATVTLTRPGVIQATCHGSDRPLLHIKTTWLYFYCKRLCMKSEIVDDLAWSGSFKWNFCHWCAHGRASCKVPCVVREQWEATLDVLSTAGFL